MPDDPDRHSYDQRSADDVWIAFGRPSPGRGGDALPLTNLEPRDVLARSCWDCRYVMKWQRQAGVSAATTSIVMCVVGRVRRGLSSVIGH